MKKKLSLLMVALVAVAAFAGLRRAGDDKVHVWDFSSFTTQVDLIGENYQAEYDGLTLVGKQDQADAGKEIVKAATGFKMNGTSSETSRYIKYTPVANGTMVVYFASNNADSQDRIVAVGTSVATFASADEVPESVVAWGFSKGYTIQSLQAKMTAGTTYYIYFANGGQTIKALEFVAEDGDITAVTSEDIGLIDPAAEYSVTKNGVTIACDNGIVATSEFRVYKGKTLTVSSENNIKKIVFVCTANGTAKYGPGCFGNGAPEGYVAGDGATGIWTGSAKEVAFTATANQVRIVGALVITEPVVINTMEIRGTFPGMSWDKGIEMTPANDENKVWKLEMKDVEVEGTKYEYKAFANGETTGYQLPAEGNQDWVFGTDEYPAGKYDLTFTADTENHTLTLDVQKVEEPKGLIPDGSYYVVDMSEESAAIASDGTMDSRGNAMTFTFNKEKGSYTIEGAEFFAEKEWTVEEDAVYGHNISTIDGGVKKYLALDWNHRNLTLSETAFAWAIIAKDEWEKDHPEPVVINTMEIRGTFPGMSWDKGIEMTPANDENKVWKLEMKDVEVEGTKYEYKAFANGETTGYQLPAEGNQDWVFGTDEYPAGKYNLTFTADTENHTLTLDVQKAEQPVEPGTVDVPADGDIAAAIAEAAAGDDVTTVTLNLAEDAKYAVTAPIATSKSIVINGNGATIDASAVSGALFQYVAPTVPASAPHRATIKDAWATAPNPTIEINGVNVEKLAKPLFSYKEATFVRMNISVTDAKVEVTDNVIVFDLESSGACVENISVANSTFYAATATTKSFFSTQSAKKAADVYDAIASDDILQTMSISNSTIYNFAKGKNFFTLAKNGQKYLEFDVKNNIFVNCGKSGQVIKGMNGGQASPNPKWVVKGNAFNFDGADTSANESTGDDAEPVQESVAGVITFTDAANGDFNGTFQLAEGAVAPEAKIGDTDWNITFKEYVAPATITSVQLSGNFAALDAWNTLDFTPVDGLGNTYECMLDLSNSATDREFKLVINGGGDESDGWAGWIGTNNVAVDAPEGWVLATGDSDNANLKLFNSTTGYQKYKVTATWTPDPLYYKGWSIKIEGTEERPDIYTVFGAFYDSDDPQASIFGTAWDPANTANDMTLADGIYTKTYESVELTPGGLSVKVAKNHKGEESYPAVAVSTQIETAGFYDVVVTFNAESKEVTLTATPKDAPAVENLYIMGTGTENAWNGTTEMAFNAETQAFEYELDVDGDIYITFGDAAFTYWDDFNANHRYAIGTGDKDATIGEAMQLQKVNGTLKFAKGKYKVSVTKTLECTITKLGEPTGINGVKNAAALKDAQIFNISGQRVEKAHKGLYIVNGKKVVVK